MPGSSNKPVYFGEFACSVNKTHAFFRYRVCTNATADEFGRWTHMASARNPRSEELTAYKEKGSTKYSFGIIKMEDVG